MSIWMRDRMSVQITQWDRQYNCTYVDFEDKKNECRARWRVYEGYVAKWVARPKIRLRSTFLEHIAFVFRVSPICKAAIYHSGAHNYELL